MSAFKYRCHDHLSECNFVMLGLRFFFDFFFWTNRYPSFSCLNIRYLINFMRDRETRNILSGENLKQGHVLIFLKRNETSNATSRRNILVGRGPLNVVAFVSTAMGPVLWQNCTRYYWRKKTSRRTWSEFFYEEEGGPQKTPCCRDRGLWAESRLFLSEQ